jgi:hypothetical protein
VPEQVHLLWGGEPGGTTNLFRDRMELSTGIDNRVHNVYGNINPTGLRPIRENFNDAVGELGFLVRPEIRVGQPDTMRIYKWSDYYSNEEDGGQGLAGAVFTLERSTGTGPDDWEDHLDSPFTTSSPDYRIEFRLSDNGVYRLTEIANPEEYILPSGYWILTTDGEGNITVTRTTSGAQPPELLRTLPWLADCPCDDEDSCEEQGCENCQMCICDEMTFHLINIREEQQPVTFSFEFHKTDQRIYNEGHWGDEEWLEGTLLAGAYFNLVRYNGTGTPADEIVTEAMIGTGANQWTLVTETPQVSSGLMTTPISFEMTLDGYYQLIETQAPTGFQTPLGQWRVVAVERTVGIGDEAEVEAGFRIIAIEDSSIPAFVNIGGVFNSTYNAHFEGRFFVGNRANLDVPTLGGVGTRVFIVLGSIILLGILGWTGYALYLKRRRTLHNW